MLVGIILLIFVTGCWVYSWLMLAVFACFGVPAATLASWMHLFDALWLYSLVSCGTVIVIELLIKGLRHLLRLRKKKLQ